MTTARSVDADSVEFIRLGFQRDVSLDFRVPIRHWETFVAAMAAIGGYEEFSGAEVVDTFRELFDDAAIVYVGREDSGASASRTRTTCTASPTATSTEELNMARFQGAVEQARRDLVESGTDTTTARRLAPRIAELHQQQIDRAQQPYAWLGARGIELPDETATDRADEPALAIHPDQACAGADDLCGAPAGQPCEPGCPSLATEEAGAPYDALDGEPNWNTSQREIEEVRA